MRCEEDVEGGAVSSCLPAKCAREEGGGVTVVAASFFF